MRPPPESSLWGGVRHKDSAVSHELNVCFFYIKCEQWGISVSSLVQQQNGLSEAAVCVCLHHKGWFTYQSVISKTEGLALVMSVSTFSAPPDDPLPHSICPTEHDPYRSPRGCTCCVGFWNCRGSCLATNPKLLFLCFCL